MLACIYCNNGKVDLKLHVWYILNLLYELFIANSNSANSNWENFLTENCAVIITWEINTINSTRKKPQLYNTIPCKSNNQPFCSNLLLLICLYYGYRKPQKVSINTFAMYMDFENTEVNLLCMIYPKKFAPRIHICLITFSPTIIEQWLKVEQERICVLSQRMRCHLFPD